MRKVVWAAAAAAGALLAGCSSSSSPAAPVATTSPSATTAAFPTADATAAGKMALLTLKAFPATWTASKSDNSDDAAIDSKLGNCVHAPAAIFKDNTADRVTVDSPDFNAPGDTDQSVSESVSITTTADIDQEFTIQKSARFMTCASSVFSAALKKSLAKEASASNVTFGKIAIQQERFPALGDGSFALGIKVPLTTQGQTFAEFLNIIYVRYQNAQIKLDFNAFGTNFSQAGAVGYTKKALKRLKGVTIPATS